jgi:flavin reductase (DIM6/NTAB) family NADH-FMN oxidoreductase RutF
VTPLHAVKAAARRVLFGNVGPEWVPVALPHPQQLVSVTLHGLGEPRDATRNNVVVSLRPLRVGLGLAPDELRSAGSSPLRLDYALVSTGRRVGSLSLQLEETLFDDSYGVFAISGRSYECLPTARRWTRYANDVRISRRPHEPGNLWMEPRDRWDLRIMYMSPRPVVLISVRHEARGNLFPMDLLGPIGPPPAAAEAGDGWGHAGRFSLALRSTSPSVELIRESRRLCLSRIPATFTDFAYELGKHHRKSDIDWAALPFPTRPSAAFGLPVPEQALAVHEFRIDEVREVGSHTVFLASPQNVEVLDSAPQMHHVAGDLYAMLDKIGHAPLLAPRTGSAPVRMGAG